MGSNIEIFGSVRLIN